MQILYETAFLRDIQSWDVNGESQRDNSIRREVLHETAQGREAVREEASNSSLQEQLLKIEKTKIESLVS